MNVNDLIPNNYYIYNQLLGEKNPNTGDVRQWTNCIKVKYICNVSQAHPELNITHCATYLFLAATPCDYCPGNTVTAVNAHILAEFELSKIDLIPENPLTPKE